MDKDLYLSKDLTWPEKAVLMEIRSLDHGQGNDLSYQHLSEFSGLKVEEVKLVITKLKSLGFISIGQSRKGDPIVLTSTKEIEHTPVLLIDDPGEEDVDEEYEVDSDESDIPINRMKDIQDVYDFWNSFKKSKGWKFHIKLSKCIKHAIYENLTDYSVEDICSAISIYHQVFTGDEYFWDHAYSLPAFLTVRYGNNDTCPKKWWQFLPDNWVRDNYLTSKRLGVHNTDVDSEEISRMVNKIVSAYANLIDSPDFIPTQPQVEKFAECAKNMIQFFEGKNIKSEDWIKYLFGCLKKNYINKGHPVYPGNLGNKTTWEILMPQYMREIGLS